MKLSSTWVPAVLLWVGAVAATAAGSQRSMPLRAELGAVIPSELEGMPGVDQTVSDQERRVAGMDSYVLRSFVTPEAAARNGGFSVYVGYYERQTRGHTIHSPKNCLPGAGWEALTSSTTTVATADGPIEVTKYLLQRDEQRAVVLYWYQGRGRIEASEYRVKWNLLRDAALHRRSDESLVRVVVPVVDSEEAALALATRVAAQVMPAVSQALPL